MDISKISVLIERNREREPFFDTLEPNSIYSYFLDLIKKIKQAYEITGILNQKLINTTLENAFTKFENKYKNSDFFSYLKKGFELNIKFAVEKGTELEEVH